MVAFKTVVGGTLLLGAATFGSWEIPPIRNTLTLTFDRLIQSDEERLAELEKYMDGYGPRVSPTESTWPMVVGDYNNPKFKGLHGLTHDLGFDTDDLCKIYYENGMPRWNEKKIKERSDSD